MGRVSRWFSSLLGGNKRWAFVKSFQNHWPSPPLPAAVAGEEQNNRAIAVAVATAAAAEVAMAAAKAAAAMLQLTAMGGSARLKLEEQAAVKIQAAFRGYLARRALRALKGLVKLQALVRGNIVRKQVAETLRCMKALVRVQAQACACRALHSNPSSSSKSSHSNPGPATPEKYESGIRSIASKRNPLKQIGGMDAVDRKGNHSADCNWLYQCMEESYWNMSEDSKSIGDEKINNEKPRFYSKQKNSLCHLQSSCCSMKFDQSSGSIVTEPNSLSKDSATSLLSTSSPLLVDWHWSKSPQPQFPSVDFGESPGSSWKRLFMPVKSEFSQSFYKGYSNYPNYMASTESSMAKFRSQSAPRQRPEYEKSNSLIKLSAQGLGAKVIVAASSGSSKFAKVAYSNSGRREKVGMTMKM